ncbi:MAG: IclR family transcriptional regulator [Nitrospiraceae bacterium]
MDTIRRAAQVLKLISRDRPDIGVTEVATAFGISASTAHELLSSLADEGLLRRTSRRRYQLGWALFALSQTLLETSCLLQAARPVMEELVAGWGETTHLAVLVDGQVLYVEKLQGDRALEIVLSRVGNRLPAHCSGVGKVLLAHRPWEEVLAIVERQGLPAFTPNTITSIDLLAAELERVRQHGYAYDQEEVMIGLCCAAAPIMDRRKRVIASMSLSVPAYRFYPNRQRLTTAIVDAARRVSERIESYEEEQSWRTRTESRSRSSARATSVRT